jgi:hypothetical protein
VRYIGADSETVKFNPGDMAPPLVCIQHQELGSTERHIQTVRAGAVATLRAFLVDPDVTLVLHNAAFDCAVWCAARLTAEVIAALPRGAHPVHVRIPTPRRSRRPRSARLGQTRLGV